MIWKQELKESLKNISDLKTFLGDDSLSSSYPVFIPKRIAQKIKSLGKDSALYKQYVPHEKEEHLEGMIDPIGDMNYRAAPQIVHRYKNRVLFLPTQVCPIYCRFCFRKNELGIQKELFTPEFEKSLDYLREHSEVEEIIFSGGDPFILDNEKIKFYLDEFSKIKHIKYFRFHTKFLTTIPSRFEKELMGLLESYNQKINIVFHINHVEEIDSEVEEIIRHFPSKINLLSQSVLLKGINDNHKDLLSLFEKLIALDIRPYYLHHPDQVKGAMHFGVSLKEGRKLYQKLRDSLPGWAIPNYVIDIPGGEGKTSAYNSETFEFSGKLINRVGQEVSIKVPLQ